MFALLDPAERVSLCEGVSRDLESAVAAVAPHAMLGGALRGVLVRVRALGGELERRSE